MFNHVGKKHVGILRATVFGLWFFIILWSPITSYSFLPEEMFKPLGIYRVIFWAAGSNLIDFLLSYKFLLFLKSALLMGTFACATGLKPYKIFSVATVMLLLIADMITKGFNGFVNHAEMGLLYSSIILMLFPSGDGFSLSKLKRNVEENRYLYLLPIYIISLTICMAYSFVGFNRAIFGGFEQFYNNALNIHLITNSLNYTKYGMNWGLVVANSSLLLMLFKTGFSIITFFEMASPLLLFSRKFRFLWLAVMIPFHLLSFITMKIFFWENTILILVIFVVIGEVIKDET